MDGVNTCLLLCCTILNVTDVTGSAAEFRGNCFRLEVTVTQTTSFVSFYVPFFYVV